MLATLIRSSQITDTDTLYVLKCPEIAAKALPGQFVEVQPDPAGKFFLRRPISIFGCDGKETFSLLVHRVGQGTEYMMSWSEGTEVDVLGPLGNGFDPEFEGKVCLLVGGGIGAAPLGYLAEELIRRQKEVKMLFSPRRSAGLLETLSLPPGTEVQIARNRKDIPELLEKMLCGVHQIYACGPEGMLELVVQESLKRDIPCQLSMERHMACGIGICLGCAIAVHTENKVVYKKVCKDGPVFEAKEVAFHEKP